MILDLIVKVSWSGNIRSFPFLLFKKNCLPEKIKLAAKPKDTWAKLKNFFYFVTKFKNVSQTTQINSCYSNKRVKTDSDEKQEKYSMNQNCLLLFCGIRTQGTVSVLGSILRIVLESSPSISFVSQKWQICSLYLFTKFHVGRAVPTYCMCPFCGKYIPWEWILDLVFCFWIPRDWESDSPSRQPAYPPSLNAISVVNLSGLRTLLQNGRELTVLAYLPDLCKIWCLCIWIGCVSGRNCCARMPHDQNWLQSLCAIAVVNLWLGRRDFRPRTLHQNAVGRQLIVLVYVPHLW